MLLADPLTSSGFSQFLFVCCTSQACPAGEAVRRAAGLTEDELQSAEVTRELRAQAGRCLARLKDLAPLAGALFPLLEAVPAIGLNTAATNADAATADAAAAHSAAARLQHVVQLWGLRDCGSWPPLIDGKQVRAKRCH